MPSRGVGLPQEGGPPGGGPRGGLRESGVIFRLSTIFIHPTRVRTRRFCRLARSREAVLDFFVAFPSISLAKININFLACAGCCFIAKFSAAGSVIWAVLLLDASARVMRACFYPCGTGHARVNPACARDCAARREREKETERDREKRKRQREVRGSALLGPA